MSDAHLCYCKTFVKIYIGAIRCKEPIEEVVSLSAECSIKSWPIVFLGVLLFCCKVKVSIYGMKLVRFTDRVHRMLFTSITLTLSENLLTKAPYRSIRDIFQSFSATIYLYRSPIGRDSGKSFIISPSNTMEFYQLPRVSTFSNFFFPLRNYRSKGHALFKVSLTSRYR